LYDILLGGLPPDVYHWYRGMGGRGGRSILGNELNYFRQVSAGRLGSGAGVNFDRGTWLVLNRQTNTAHACCTSCSAMVHMPAQPFCFHSRARHALS